MSKAIYGFKYFIRSFIIGFSDMNSYKHPSKSTDHDQQKIAQYCNNINQDIMRIFKKAEVKNARK